MKHFTCAETASLIRRALKEAFKGIKFSVKSKTYSGGASIGVAWTDGPNTAQVEAVISRFEASYFDGMADYKGSRYHLMEGKQVQFGADYIFANRDYSDAAIERAIDRVFSRFAGNFAGSNVQKPTVEDYRQGRARCVEIPLMNAVHVHDLQWFIGQALSKHSDRLKVDHSAIAGSVFVTHTDRNGQSDFDAVRATL